MSPDAGPEEPGGTDRPDPAKRPDLLGRLDPERAQRSARPATVTLGASAPVDTRRYRSMIGIFGLFVVVVVSVYLFLTHGVGTTGVPPGQRLHYFAAPLANTSLVGDPDLSPPCTLARHDPRALNVCLLAQRGPLVLSFFVTGSGECERQVDALQRLAGRYDGSGVQFAAVAVSAGRAATDALIRSHHWTIPVAYDRDGSVGGLYGVAVCPMAELADRGGVVRYRLIGNRWQSIQALAPRVQALAAANRRVG